MLLIRRFALCLLLAVTLPHAALAAAKFDNTRAQAELAAINVLSETSVLDALRWLEALEANLAPDVSYALRRALLRAEVWMREDAGQLERSYAADQKALQLAIANNDPATAALSSLSKVRQMLDQNRIDEAEATLSAILATLPKNPSVMLTVRPTACRAMCSMPRPASTKPWPPTLAR